MAKFLSDLISPLTDMMSQKLTSTAASGNHSSTRHLTMTNMQEMLSQVDRMWNESASEEMKKALPNFGSLSYLVVQAFANQEKLEPVADLIGSFQRQDTPSEHLAKWMVYKCVGEFKDEPYRDDILKDLMAGGEERSKMLANLQRHMRSKANNQFTSISACATLELMYVFLGYCQIWLDNRRYEKSVKKREEVEKELQEAQSKLIGLAATAISIAEQPLSDDYSQQLDEMLGKAFEVDEILDKLKMYLSNHLSKLETAQENLDYTTFRSMGTFAVLIFLSFHNRNGAVGWNRNFLTSLALSGLGLTAVSVGWLMETDPERKIRTLKGELKKISDSKREWKQMQRQIISMDCRLKNRMETAAEAPPVNGSSHLNDVPVGTSHQPTASSGES